jgi:hypothetical protein
LNRLQPYDKQKQASKRKAQCNDKPFGIYWRNIPFNFLESWEDYLANQFISYQFLDAEMIHTTTPLPITLWYYQLQVIDCWDI